MLPPSFLASLVLIRPTAEPPASEALSLPVADASDAPDAAESPDIPDTDVVSDAPESPVVPDIPDTPDAPAFIQEPLAPEAPVELFPAPVALVKETLLVAAEQAPLPADAAPFADKLPALGH
jgi:hypothetical protein